MKKIYNDKVVYGYLLIQPILDILTFFSIEKLKLSFNVGILIRSLFLVFALWYLFKEKDKKINIYLFILGIFGIINIGINYFLTDGYHLLREIIEITKLYYLPVSLLFFYKYFKNNKEINSKFLAYNTIIIGLSLILAKVLGSGACTYGIDDNCIYGFGGWFYSANEAGAILAILCFADFYNYFKNNTKINLVALLLAIFSMLYLGTKVALFGLVLCLGLFLLYYLIKFISYRKKEIFSNLILIVVLFGIVLLCVPHFPACLNNKELFNSYGIACWGVESPTIKPGASGNEGLTYEESKTILLNGRDTYLEKYHSLDVKILQKLIGMGRVNPKVDGKVIERDIYDLYYGYGIIGVIIILFLPLVLVLYALKLKIKSFKNFLNLDNMLLLSLITILGASMIAGHILFAPAVSVYIAYILVYYTLNKEE